MYNVDDETLKKTIEEILDEERKTVDVKTIPGRKSFKQDCSYHGPVTSLFVDIRDSTSLFQNQKQKNIARIIRAFSYGIAQILTADSFGIRETGIRGDCVYAIFSFDENDDNLKVLTDAFDIADFLSILNETLSDHRFQTIKAGIGISTDAECVVKTKGISRLVWIGGATSAAAKLSEKANSTDKTKPISISKNFSAVIERALDRITTSNPDSAKDIRNHLKEKVNEPFDV